MKQNKAFIPLKHAASGSLLFLEVQKINGKVVITDRRFASGNVVSLKAVRNALAEADRELI
jgi:hypothetical protein